MTNILKIRDKIMGTQKAWRPHIANLNNSTKDSSHVKERHEMYITERKQAEAALKESEEKFSKAFRSSPDAIAITTLKDGRFIEVNDSYTRINGYTREDVIGHTASELGAWTKAGDRERILGMLKERGRVHNEEADLCTKSGDVRTSLFSAELINIDGEPCMISIASDITERKQAEEALRESEEFSTSLLENAPNPITVINPDTSVKYVNPAFEKLTGFSLAEIAGIEAPYPWWPEERWSNRLNGLKGFMTGGSKITQQTIQNKNGEFFLVEMNMVRVMHNGEFKYYMAHWNDITERKQAEEALANEAIRRRILIEQSSDGIVILNQNGKVYEANRRFAEMLGYSSEEVIQLYAWDWDTQWTREQLLDMLHSVDEAGDHFETYHQRKDGTIYDVEISTNGATFAGRKFVFCVCRDITERKRAEEALREREKRFSDIAENSLEWIWEVDTEGKYTYSSPVVENVLGYKHEEMLEEHFYDSFHPDDREELKKAAFEAFAQKERFREFINRNIHKNGKTVILSTSGVPIIDEEGNLLGYRGVDTDITERKRAEEALIKAEKKYRDLLDNTNELIQSVTPDGRFRYVNNGWKQALGYSDEEIAKLSVFDIVHPDCLEYYRMIFEKIKAGEDVGQIKATFVSKDGSDVVVEGNVTCKFVDGELVYTRSILRDITKNKYLEEQMFRLSSAVSMSTDCIVITDFDAKIIDVNQKTLEMYGADSKDELLGRHFLELIAPSEREMVNIDVGEIIEKGSLECREYNILSKQGRKCPVQMSTSLVRDADGKPMGMVRVGREFSNLN